MRRLLTLLALGVLALTPARLMAQQRTVTGTVTAAETGQGLPGVTVMVKGTQIGTLTQEGGTFSLQVPQGQVTLVFRALGYKSVERTTSASTVNVQLTTSPVALEGITVTALGVTRQKRQIGYTVQDINTDEVTDVPAGNFVENLQGKISGAVMKSSPYPGGSVRIVLRGINSLTGNNEPLFVIDGVPIDNSGGGNASYGGGFDYGNAAGIIDPSNIKSISVLKGANAAALYGSRGSNGVIIIETKDGRSGAPGVTASQTVEFTTPLRLPDFQNRYGQGQTSCAYTTGTAATDCTGDFQFVDGMGGGVNDYFDESWGPALDCQPVDQFQGQGQPFCPHPDNVRNYYGSGVTYRTTGAFNAASDNAQGRVGINYEYTDGMAPGNTIENASLYMTGGLDVSDKASINGTVNYIRANGDRRPGVGYSDFNPNQQLFTWFGRQIDTKLLKNWECVDNKYGCGNAGVPFVNWNYNYHDNPYFIQLGHHNFDQTDRIIGALSGNYDFTDWLTGEVRQSVDWYREQRNRDYHWGSQPYPDGGFARDQIYRRGYNSSARLSTDQFNLTQDLGLSLTGGGNIRIEEYDNDYVFASTLNVHGIYNASNAAGTPTTTQETTRRKVYSLFGDAEFSWQDWAFLSLTGRNDWSSTLPASNRSYFYPSASLAIVWTDALNVQSDILTYGKIRGSWARVGSDTDPYQLQSTYPLTLRGWPGTTGYEVPNTLKNSELKPEETDSWELGGELDFWGGRAMATYTYYHQVTKDQILPVQVSWASGFNNQVINAGKVKNTGHEVQLTGRPIETDDLSWDITLNWGKNDNEVVSLAQGLETLVLGGAWGMNLEARVGQPYGDFYGRQYLRDDQGRLVLSQNGFGLLPVADPSPHVLGNVNPDWTGAVGTQLSYKDLDFSVLFDVQHGGNLFSSTVWFGEYSGTLSETLNGRQNGPCDPGIQLSGVDESGNPISGTVCPQAYYENSFYSHKLGIVDASYIKLRQARIGYNLPESWARAIGFKNLHVSVIGRNLWLHSKVKHIDPDFTVRSDNVQGFEHGQFPTGRTIGVTLSVVP